MFLHGLVISGVVMTLIQNKECEVHGQSGVWPFTKLFDRCIYIICHESSV